MKKLYFIKTLIFALFLLPFITSCKKNKSQTATPTNLGVYGFLYPQDSVDKQLVIAITQLGNVSMDNGLVFDTGSGGMVIDAEGILPASMITANGFNFTGDSITVNGITITNRDTTIQYGDDCSTTNDYVYGNLAYAQVTVGDQNGSIVIKRLPFFLYYKALMANGDQYEAHEFDVFGVNQEYDLTFSNNAIVQSPFNAFDPGLGLTRGFKMAALSTADFSLGGTYNNILTLGLTPADLSTSSGFLATQLTEYPPYGYVPYIPAKVTYNGTSFSTDILFDTGTSGYSFLEDPNSGDATATPLPTGSSVSLTTGVGFNYSYTTTSNENLTNIENGQCVPVSILSIEFFLGNEYMDDYADHTLGLKNN